MLTEEEFFGDPSKVALMKRGYHLWSLLGENPRFAYYGRLLALCDPGEDTADILIHLAGLQGAAVCYFYPKKDAEALFRELGDAGLCIDRHEHFWGGQAALAASREALLAYRLPNDLNIVTIDAKTPIEILADVARLCDGCGVMPVPGSVMRGGVIKGVCVVAIDKDGRAVATASSYMLHHPLSSRSKDAFWGMLATREDRRGEKISLLLGAQVILYMWERYGARGFMTGVRADNHPSKALCNKLGVIDSDWIFAQAINERVLGGSSITK